MCGIVGMVVKPTNGFSIKTEAVFNQLLYADAVRGEDSTGVIGVETNTTFHIAKEATAAAWFLNSLEVESSLPKTLFTSGKAILGHNRKKTMGKIEDASAHPFVINEHFAMVHNGTLYNHKALANTEVDSEALATVLEKAFGEVDMVGAVGDALAKVTGAYAVAIYDQRSHSVHLLRNDERPLFYTETSEGWFWASEAGLLYWILSRNHIETKDIKSLPISTIFSIDLDTNTASEEVVKIKKPMTTTTTLPVVGGGNAISKKGFKKLQASLLHKTIEWWPDDFIPRTHLDGSNMLVMGSGHEFSFAHDVKGYISTKNLVHTMETLDGALCTGLVFAVDRHKINGKLTIWVKNIKPLGTSNEKNIAAMSETELKKYQFKKSSQQSIFGGGLQSVAYDEDEHRENAV